MPRIPSVVLDCVFYLYHSKEEAEKGGIPEGTGFIVSRPVSGAIFHYGITNRHVLQSGGSIIRLNTTDGRTNVIETDPSDWESQSPGEDIAALPIKIDTKNHKVAGIPTALFAKPEDMERGQISLGDDVFMLGLFIDHVGQTTNVPKARFGNISMLSNSKAPISHAGYDSESHIIDLHSRTGFSGSPVFVYRTLGSDLTTKEFGRVDLRNLHDSIDGHRGEVWVHFNPPVFKFLGIHWAQFPEKWDIKDKDRVMGSRRASINTDGQYVEGMSGMTCVAPSWKILEILDMPKLKETGQQA